MADDRWIEPEGMIFMPKGMISQGMPKALPHFSLAQVKMTADSARVKKMVNMDGPRADRV